MPATDYTLTYSETVKGWPSFYSYMPEYIMGMNQYLYTFKGGNLYRHNTNTIRNRYYGVDYPSTMTSVFNQEPTTVKVFKTIEEKNLGPLVRIILSSFVFINFRIFYYVFNSFVFIK